VTQPSIAPPSATVQAPTAQGRPRLPATIRLVVTNISGGEGKSTLTRELAFLLQARGYRVALMDSDPQASLTKSLGLQDDPAMGASRLAKHTILPVFEVETTPRLGEPLTVRGVDVWVSNDHLYEADSKISGDLARQGNLREAIDALEGRYDFILLDTKPGITPLLNAAVAAADHMLVPVSGDKGMENLDKLSRLMKAARGFSPAISVAMFIPNRQRLHTSLSKAVLADLQASQEHAGAKAIPISQPIRDSVTIGEAARMRIPLVEYAPRADITADFQRVTDELLGLLGIQDRAVRS
jgi:chromosome partitioning protein